MPTSGDNLECVNLQLLQSLPCEALLCNREVEPILPGFEVPLLADVLEELWHHLGGIHTYHSPLPFGQVHVQQERLGKEIDSFNATLKN